MEARLPSPAFTRNFSITFTEKHKLWNELMLGSSPLLPQHPSDPAMPSEAQFSGSSFGFRPIGGGF